MARPFVLAVLVLFSVMLAAFGVYLGGIGLWLLTSEGEPVGAVAVVAMAALVLYGAYLFGRAAWRTRHATVASGAVRAILTGCLVALAAALVWPTPNYVRVLVLVSLVLTLPLLLAEEFEPPKLPRRQR